MRKRLTPYQKHVLALLSQQESISYDAMCAELDIDYRTAFRAVAVLERRGLIRKHGSRGRIPNRYEVLAAA